MQNAISIHTIASRRARTAGGFTLTELLTVVAIIVLLIGSLFAAISAAKLVLTPKLINATRPLDASGADDLIELPDTADDENAADNDNDTTED